VSAGASNAAFEEANLVRCRVDQDHLAPDAVRFDSWAEERVALLFEFGVESCKILDRHDDGASRRAVSVVRRQIQDHRPSRDLYEDRAVALALLPVELAAQVLDVEALRRFDIEHPKDRNGGVQPEVHFAIKPHAETADGHGQ
jgi:hypothetical protein